jgi:nucleoside-diphosphate-sugar epimerase
MSKVCNMTFDRILVTGSTGFLGSAIVAQAFLAGIPVTATDQVGRVNTSGVPFISADILDPNSLPKIFEGVDCVCHVAGLAHIFDKSESLTAPFHAINVTGTDNVARAAVMAGVRHFTFISSVSVYGGEAYDKDESSACQPEGPYAESKFSAERCLIELCQKKGVNLTILRLATLYGEGDPGNVAGLIDAINRRRFIWVGKGENIKSLLHREDAARACIAAMNTQATGVNIFNVSSPPVRMRDIVEAIITASGNPIPAWHISASATLTTVKILKKLSFNHGPFANMHDTLQKWLADDYYNTDRFCDAFNYQTKMTLEEGIRREVEWYKAGRRKLNSINPGLR